MIVFLGKHFFLLIFRLLFSINLIKCKPIYQTTDLDLNHWRDINYYDKLAADSILINLEDAQNVVVFIADGMGPETITAARIYGKSEEKYLFFERFPSIGKIKTYIADKLVPHCASTPIFCGGKGNDYTIGVDSDVLYDDCDASLHKGSQLVSLFTLAQKNGKDTGFVTNTRVTHDTVAALYAHSPNSKWECDAFMTNKSVKCKDIARQLIEDIPGRNIKVIMGGGMQCLKSDSVGSWEDPIDKDACYSIDGRDLIRDWSADKERRHVSHEVVTNSWELEKITHVDFILGIFANSHLKYEHKRDASPYGMPSLTAMAEKALDVLRKNKNGFFLVVEGGLIDEAHHEGHAKIALDETIAFDNAVERIVIRLEQLDMLRNTLVIVTADHATSMVMTGYPNRHSSILGLSQPAGIDNTNYTVLTYAAGGPNNFQFYADDTNGNVTVLVNPLSDKTTLHDQNVTIQCPQQKIRRIDPSTQDTEEFIYYQQAGILTDKVTHSGTDVNVYALGPMSHLVHGTHEQTYLYYLMGFASNVGPVKKVKDYTEYLI